MDKPANPENSPEVKPSDILKEWGQELNVIDPDKGSPPWFDALSQLIDTIDVKDSKQAVADIGRFFDGELTWAQVQGIPQLMLFDIAEKGYLKFKSGRLKEAEAIFKGLCLIDHKTGYYHTALGAIYQKQEKWLDALAEYTVSVELDPEDITAYVNRGEVYYMLGLDEEPLKNFEAAIKLDPEGKDPWANRARFLSKQIQAEMVSPDWK